MADLHRSKRWASLKAEILLRDLWLCQMCGTTLTAGRSGHRAAVVDHKQPIRIAEALQWEPSNLWAVCRGCHDGACRSIEQRTDDPNEIQRMKEAHRPVGLDGYPIGGGVKSLSGIVR